MGRLSTTECTYLPTFAMSRRVLFFGAWGLSPGEHNTKAA